MQDPAPPTLAELAYLAYCHMQATPQPLYKALAFDERLGWALGVDAAVRAALALPGDTSPARPAPVPPLLDSIAALRQGVVAVMHAQHLSFKRTAHLAGVDRHTLMRWVAGEENVTVHSLLCLEAWLSCIHTAAQGASPATMAPP